MRAPAKITLVLMILFTAWPGRGETLLRPGLSLSYRMELLNEGKRSEENLELRVLESAGDERWRIQLELGGDAMRYRAVYYTAGDSSPFASSRFESVEVWEESWRPADPERMEIFATLREMEALLSGKTWDAESTLVVGAHELPCRRYTFVDSTENVQVGESVTLRTAMRRVGEAWITDGLPFGGWVSYREERSSRKISEFAGRRFEGAEETSRETWKLSALDEQ